MGAADMDISITGNVSQGVTSLKQVQTELSKTAVAAQKTDSSLQVIGKTLPGLSNKAHGTATALQGIGSAAGGAVGEVSALGSALLTGGIAAALPLIIAGLNALEESFSQTSRSQRALAQSFAESEAAVAGNVARLESLVSIAKNVANSDKVRQEALGALNKEYDGFNGKLTLANINTAESIKLIDQQTDAIVRQAKIKGVEELITKVAQKQAEIATRDLKENLSLINKAERAILGVFNPAIGTADEVARGLERRGKLLKEGEAEINRYKQVLRTLLEEEAAGGTLFKEKVVKPKAEKDLRTISDVLREMRLQIEALNTKEIELKTNEAKGKISALDGAIKELITKFGKPGKENTVQLFAEIRQIQFVEALKKTLETTVKGKELKIEPIISVEPVIKRGDFEERMQKALDLKNAAKKLAQDFNDIINNTIVEGLSGLGESIGKAIGGGGFESIFKGIFNTIGSGLQALGKLLIKTYAQIAIIKKIGFSNPVVGIAAGVALVALGALLKNTLQKSGGFATGSRSTPGGSFLVGERGAEMITLPQGSRVQPNNELQAYNSDQGGFVASTSIRGSELVILVERAKASMGRAGSVATYR